MMWCGNLTEIYGHGTNETPDRSNRKLASAASGVRVIQGLLPHSYSSQDATREEHSKVNRCSLKYCSNCDNDAHELHKTEPS
jgi:hypothetical protein